MVAGRQLFPHPFRQADTYLLGKLMAFHLEHRTDPAQVRQDPETAVAQLPKKPRADEAQHLQA
jgi:hypothetical protein